MTPFERGLQVYSQHPDMDLLDDLETHMRNAFMACTPQVFAMLRPVRRDWPLEWLQDTKRVEPLETADCWFVWLLAGDLATACQWLPRELPWFAFSRRGKPIRFAQTAKLLKKSGCFPPVRFA